MWLTLEHVFELHRFTHTWIFFFQYYISQVSPLLVESAEQSNRYVRTAICGRLTVSYMLIFCCSDDLLP